MMLIRIEDVCKRYQSADCSFDAVKHANLEIGEGEYVCIAGRSGSGKSTLLNMLAGLTRPSSGKIYFRDEDLWKREDAAISWIRNHDMSYMMQGFSMLGSLTLLENVMLPAQIYALKPETQALAVEMLRRVGLDGKENNYPRQLSGGEVRRGMIARALMNQPSIFISDEPTDGLDEATAEIIMDLFDEIHEAGTTLLVVSHERHFMQRAQRLYRMEAGCLSEEER